MKGPGQYLYNYTFSVKGSSCLLTYQIARLQWFFILSFSPSTPHGVFHIFDHTNTRILVRNNADHAIKILTHPRLSCVTELPYKNCFTASADLDVAYTPLTLPTIFHDRNSISISPAEDLETELPNGIKIYRDKKAIDTITCLVNEYPSIWKSSGFIQVPPKWWIKVHLKPR